MKKKVLRDQGKLVCLDPLSFPSVLPEVSPCVFVPLSSLSLLCYCCQINAIVMPFPMS